MDIGAWLRGLGLGRYEQAFRDNDVDADLLASIYGWFTEGLDTPDLKEAGALLDQLTSAPPGSRARPRRRSAALVNNPG